MPEDLKLNMWCTQRQTYHVHILVSPGCHGLSVCCMVVIWPGFLGEYVLSKNWLRRMGRGNIGGVRGREWGADQEAGV